VLSALQDVLLAYLRRDVATEVPFWRMAETPVATLRTRAEHLAIAASRGRGLGPAVSAEPMESLPGAGSLPGTVIESYGVVLEGDRSAALRYGEPPIIARVRDGRTALDLRTVDPGDDARLELALASLPPL
jgi:L-seryl-tRNA(Ser) seleniumtransferase